MENPLETEVANKLRSLATNFGDADIGQRLQQVREFDRNI